MSNQKTRNMHLKGLIKDLPWWFKLINLVILLPILLWPIIFFGTIFFFDDPNASKIKSYGLFFLVNGYPLYLIGLAILNVYIFRKKPALSLILPVAMIGFLTWVFLDFLK